MLFAQTPQMTYQAVIRDASGQLLTNRSVSATVKVMVGGSELFSQTYTEMTNVHGLLTVTFGDAGFATIDWANASISCEVYNGTDVYIAENFQPVTAVPLAIKAITESDPQFNASVASNITAGDTLYWNHKLDAEVDGSVTNELQSLTISHDTVYLTSNGGFVKLPEVNVTTSLDDAYNHGPFIIADSGAVTINGTDGLLATGTLNSGTIPASGAGIRMMWYPRKAAFRAGYVTNTQWDDINIGQASTAMGLGTTASGQASTALGLVTTAIGQASTAMGIATTASGHFSTAMGSSTTASGYCSNANGVSTTASGHASTAMGANTIASGIYSIAIGYNTTSSGDYSIALGDGSIASSFLSTALGFNTRANAPYSTTMGLYTISDAYASVALGRYNLQAGHSDGWYDADPLFVIGNGTDASNRSNALSVYKNGNMDVNGNINVNGIVTDTSGNSTNWNTAYSWGNHASAGYLTSFTEVDPVFLAWDKDYTDLINTPTIPTVPTNVSDFTNDAGYLTAEVDASVSNELQALSISHDTVYLSNGGFVKLPAVIDTTSLDDAYNNGSEINADAGPVTINGDGGFLAVGTLYSGTIPASGAGTRMMWYPGQAAFRVGYVEGSQWDEANVGRYSTAMGYNTTAKGNISTAMGFLTSASGFSSTAIGFLTSARGTYSTSIGRNTIANGRVSISLGESTKAQSYASVVLGRANLVAGDSLFWRPIDPLFVIGNGADTNNRSNALTVYKNGNMDVNGNINVNGIVTDTSGNSTNWNTAYGWGDHALVGYLTSYSETDPAVAANFDFSGAATGDLLRFNGTKWVKVTPNYLTTEVDGSVTNEIQTLSLSGNDLSISGTGGNTVTLPAADGAETQVTAGANVSITGNGTTASPYEGSATQTPGTTPGEMQYWNGTAWVTVSTGNEGQVLTVIGGVPTWKTEVGDNFVINFNTGKIWMDRNLGASQVATNSTDAAAYGDLYQWGRAPDGHENRTSGTTSTLSNSDTPGHGYFITNYSSPSDWRSLPNDNLWQGVNGTNNPCPSGYRLPTETEWETERQSWSSNNADGAFASPLKLTLGGLRLYGDGSLYNVGTNGYYWSSSMAGALNFYSSNALTGIGGRANGFSVRCIKD